MSITSFVNYPFSVPAHVSEFIKTSTRRLYTEVTWPPVKNEQSIPQSRDHPKSPVALSAAVKKPSSKGFNFSKSLKGIKSETGSAVITPGDGAETFKVQDASFGGQRARVVHLAPHALQEGFAERTLEKLDAISKGPEAASQKKKPESFSSGSAVGGSGRRLEPEIDDAPSVGDMAKLFSSLNSIGTASSSSSTSGGASYGSKSTSSSSYVSCDPRSMLCDVSGDDGVLTTSSRPSAVRSASHPSHSPSLASSSSSSSVVAGTTGRGLGSWGADTCLVGALKKGFESGNRGPCHFCGHTCRFTSYLPPSSPSTSPPLAPSSSESGSGSEGVWEHAVREGVEVQAVGGNKGGKKADGEGAKGVDSNPNPDAVQMVVVLPKGVASAGDVDFLVGLRSFEVAVPNVGRLKIQLPYSVDEDKCTAHFSKAKRRLTVTTVKRK